MIRDMSQRQFAEALKRHGMRRVGIMGYVEMDGGKLAVSMYNANTLNRRKILAYLLKEKEKYEAEKESLKAADEREMERRHAEDTQVTA